MPQKTTTPYDPGVRGAVVEVPGAPVTKGWTARYALASTGMWLAFLTPAQVQIARQAEVFSPDGKEALLGLATGVGAAVTAVAVPAFGAVSDRTRSRFGRRRPWVALGSLLAAVGILLLATATGAVTMVCGWAVAQLGLSAVQAGLVAAIPDRVPKPQLGTVAGWAGMTQMLGALLGTVLVNQLVTGLVAGYAACAVVAVVSVVPFLAGHREQDTRGAEAAPARPATAAPAPPAGGPVSGPRKSGRPLLSRPASVPRDLLWTWVSRFLVVLGFALITQYLLYYLTDALRVDEPQEAMLTVTAATVLCAMAAALIAGRWSDRAGRRRVFVAAGGAAMGLGALGLALLPSWPVTVGAAIAVGTGFGTFLAVDLAVIASVLPSAADTGRDLGIFAIATATPQVLAPVLAVPVLAVAGYGGLYVLTAVVSAAGGAAVLLVRSVR
ncbi:MFS/sugar transport protein [Streptomyces sp. WMMB 714]|uniref:MFS transporter n=1 Tax=Streptomyces sp. WMMB 714 TaxID=1286822 RepID=UPI0005F86CEA|nr:MFS transporter [Streptomyces sp. WMMB 714]SCK40124.1 MFS/sugar transport protein [Streptomyces sp. WMMB 714]